MKCLLCALTGVGNDALLTLLESSVVTDILVVTRREPDEFPYYPCGQLTDLCAKKGVRCLTDLALCSEEAYAILREFAPDVLIAATFDQIIPQNVLALPAKEAINVHPSLLPRYRGATPTNWAIICGEERSGVTIHKLTVELDGGDILLARDCPIRGLTDGEVRQRLSMLAGEMLAECLVLLETGDVHPRKQDLSQASSFPKITSEKGLSMLRRGNYSQEHIRLGLTPFPGVKILDGI